MHAVIVVESSFGNSRAVASEVAKGLGDAEVLDVAEAPSVFADDVALVVLGGPTHAFGMSRPGTREDAVRQGGVSQGLGLREFLQGLEPGQDLRFAVFDTRVAKVRHLPGSAARGAAKALRRKGYRLAADPESFYVLDVQGPLLDGEQERAQSWGERLAVSVP
ncbi:MAG TPA: flavodoxin/nitric oxide synthase [Intrasporangium sp.]|nr:flavodoxin/nitric oxide synthase [Intrasporangium sp.]